MFHFGASTRIYILRERPSMPKTTALESSDKLMSENDQIEGGLLGLPETEYELDVCRLLTSLYFIRDQHLEFPFAMLFLLFKEPDRV